jgi:hypothetical protein
MKIQALLLSASLAVAGVSSAHAQISRPVANGAVLGAVAGAFIGGHNNDRWGEGAIIGAAAGAVLGAVVDQAQNRPTVVRQGPPVTVVKTVPASSCPPTQVVVVPQSGPKVVVVQPAPRVVYVPAPAPRVIVVEEGRRHRHPGNVVYVTPGHPRW